MMSLTCGRLFLETLRDLAGEVDKSFSAAQLRHRLEVSGIIESIFSLAARQGRCSRSQRRTDLAGPGPIRDGLTVR